jgi:hypothetical protein
MHDHTEKAEKVARYYTLQQQKKEIEALMDELKADILRDVVPTKDEAVIATPHGSFSVKRVESDTRRFDPVELGTLYRGFNAPEIAWLPDPKYAPTLVKQGLVSEARLLELKVGNITIYPKIRLIGE